jgi:16S rRNA (uracil1498-N3)-methyltransferase
VSSPAAAPWRTSAAQVLVQDLDHPVLDRDVAHHLGRVLRLRAGASVTASDGAGGWRPCTFDGDAALVPDGPAHQEPAPAYPVTVGFALVKGQKPELVVQKLTELGVDRIVVFSAERSVVRWDEQRAAKQFERLDRVAREACAQCRRLWTPTVVPGTIAELLGRGAVAADAGGRPLRRHDHLVIVGPEGGWAEGELVTPAGEAERVALGEHVLRAETAAITAGVLLTSLRAGLVDAADPVPGAGGPAPGVASPAPDVTGSSDFTQSGPVGTSSHGGAGHVDAE